MAAASAAAAAEAGVPQRRHGLRRCSAPRRPGLLLLCTGCGNAALGVEIGGTVGLEIPTELPGPAWPAASAVDSNASWPSGHQPARFETWPQTGFGTPQFVLHPCWKTTVVRDTANGWPGNCQGLLQARTKKTLLDCRDLCWNEPRCAVWQFNNASGSVQCRVGFGTGCSRRAEGSGEPQVLAAQRLQHGEVRVLRNLTGLRIQNLWHLGSYQYGTQEKNIANCRSWCYADVACQYWTYGSTGCWVDAPFFSTHRGTDKSQVVQYPLTSSGLSMDPDMVAGEYLQHYCPPRQTPSHTPLGAPVSDGDAAGPGGHLFWGLVIAGTCFSACAGLLVWGLASHRLSGGQKKKTRAMVPLDNEQDSSYSDVEDRQPLMDAFQARSTLEARPSTPPRGGGESCTSSFYHADRVTIGLNPGPPLRAELTAPVELTAPAQLLAPVPEPVWVPKLMSFQSTSLGAGAAASGLDGASFAGQVPGRLPSQLLQPPVPAFQGNAPGTPVGAMPQFKGGAPASMPF